MTWRKGAMGKLKKKTKELNYMYLYKDNIDRNVTYTTI